MVKKHALRPLAALLALLAALTLAGCSTFAGDGTPAEPTLLSATEKAGERLLEGARGQLANETVIATTLVEVDQLDQTSTLGRTLSEALTSRLVEGGLNVIEVKLRDNLYIEELAGEMILSRNIQRLGNNYDATTVLLGTYAVGINEVLVNARLVRLGDRSILSATSFRVPLDSDVQSLLAVPY